MAKTIIFWPWWQSFNSFCFEAFLFWYCFPFFFFATQKSGGLWNPPLPGPLVSSVLFPGYLSNYNYISDDSKICILKTKCVPSQRVSMKKYNVWIICCKYKRNFIGEEILAGYCTYTAGLLGSCNHIVGLMFRAEAAVLTGYCNPTCTSTLATWNIPRGKKQIQPDEVSKLRFTHDTYMKKSNSRNIRERKD